MSIDLTELERFLANQLQEDKEIALKVGAEETDKIIKENFANEGANVEGGPWKKKKNPDGRKTLTGKTTMLSTTAGAYADIPNDQIVMHSNTPYDEIHNEGGTIHIPEHQRKIKNKGGFANKKHKKTKDVTIPAHDITIEKREFLTVGNKLDDVQDKMKEAVEHRHRS